MIGSAAVHVWLSHQFWLKEAWERPVIDGGPLGFLTWSIPVLMGTFAADWLTGTNKRSVKMKLVVAGIVLMLLGYGLSCLTLSTAQESQGLIRYAPPPFTAPLATDADQKGKSSVDLWTMSQRTGSASYQTFAAGFALIVLFLCCVIFDQERQIGLFRTLGSNALVAYIVQGLAIDSAHHLLPSSAPLWAVVTGMMAVLAITWLVCRYLETRAWYVRL
jgi:fucose 4-O-acetylase-like acetyltransferase